MARIRKSLGNRGFTLIELLIVIAIILILIAIALPNFLDAQVRAKVASTRGALRTVQTAMESYYTDYRQYPVSHRFSFLNRASPPNIDGSDLRLLSTPVPYITELPRDPFTNKDGNLDRQGTNLVAYSIFRGADGRVKYSNPGSGPFGREPVPFDSWMGWSAGPDNVAQTGGYRPEKVVIANEQLGLEDYRPSYGGVRYSATNGTLSLGDLYVFGPGAIAHY